MHLIANWKISGVTEDAVMADEPFECEDEKQAEALIASGAARLADGEQPKPVKSQAKAVSDSPAVKTEHDAAKEPGEGDKPKGLLNRVLGGGGKPGDGEGGTGGEGRPEQEAQVKADIRMAIEDMLEEDPEKGNELWWTKGGIPRDKILDERVGYDITAAERDHVLEEMAQDAE
ncbi:MAG TPA: hypothetical protein ENI80_03540 [Acidiferrobacteraceae bacterium]|nr:hypothetical protein [Acidiferrobacteraceae bacterium]